METTVRYRTTYTEKIYLADPEKSPLVSGSLDVSNGKIDLFFLTQEDYNKYMRGGWFGAFYAELDIDDRRPIAFVPRGDIAWKEPIYILLVNREGSVNEVELQLNVVWEVFERKAYTEYIQTVTTQQLYIGPLAVVGIPLIIMGIILLSLYIQMSRMAQAKKAQGV